MSCCCGCASLAKGAFDGTSIPASMEQIAGTWASGGTIDSLRYVETSDTDARLIHTKEDTGDPTNVSMSAKVALGDGTSQTKHRLIFNYIPAVEDDPETEADEAVAESFIFVDVWADPDGDCAHSQTGYVSGLTETLLGEVETFSYEADGWTTATVCRAGQTIKLSVPFSSFKYDASESPPLPNGLRAGLGTAGTVDDPARFREFEFGHCEDCATALCDNVTSIDLNTPCLWSTGGSVAYGTGFDANNVLLGPDSYAIYNLGNRGELNEWVPVFSFIASDAGTEVKILFDVLSPTECHYLSIRIETDAVYSQIKTAAGTAMSALVRSPAAAISFGLGMKATAAMAVDYRDVAAAWIGWTTLGGSIATGAEKLNGYVPVPYGGTKFGIGSGDVPGTLIVQIANDFSGIGDPAGTATAISAASGDCRVFTAATVDTIRRCTIQNRTDWQNAIVTVPAPSGWLDDMGGVTGTCAPCCALSAVSGTWALSRSGQYYSETGIGFSHSDGPCATRAATCNSVSTTLSVTYGLDGLLYITDGDWQYTWSRADDMSDCDSSLEFELTSITLFGSAFPYAWDSSARIIVDLDWNFD